MTAGDTHQVNPTDTTRRAVARLAKLWAAGSSTAVVLVALAYLVAQEFARPLVVAGTGDVTLGNVAAFTVVGATVGATLAYVVERLTRRPRQTFLALTVIAVTAYAVIPFKASESIETAVWLNIFHVVVAVPVIGILIRWLPADRASGEA